MTRNDRDYVTHFLDGDEETVALFERWIQNVVAKKGWRQTLELDDIRQETFETLLQNLRNGKYRGGSLYSYVTQICLNKCVDAFRHRARSVRLNDHIVAEAETQAGLAGDIVDDNQKQEWARKILERLAPPCRDLIVTIYYHGVAQQDAAKQLGIGYGALRKRLHDCMKKVHRFREEIERTA